VDDANAPSYILYIKGNVEKRAPTKYELSGYNNGNGEIRIKENNIRIDLLSTETKSFSITVMNFSETNPSIFMPLNLPNFIVMDGIEALNPGAEIEINFKYDATKRGEIGFYKDIITIQTQDQVEPKISLFIDATISEDFSKLSPKQLQDAPVANLEMLNLDFGKVDKSANSTIEVKMYNNGKNPLQIRQLRSSNTVFTIVADKNEISKGSFATLSVTLNSKNRRGLQNATIDIVTNDPANSTLLLNCKGELSQ
jgi:hypothetical protein